MGMGGTGSPFFLAGRRCARPDHRRRPGARDLRLAGAEFSFIVQALKRFVVLDVLEREGFFGWVCQDQRLFAAVRLHNRNPPACRPLRLAALPRVEDRLLEREAPTSPVAPPRQKTLDGRVERHIREEPSTPSPQIIAMYCPGRG